MANQKGSSAGSFFSFIFGAFLGGLVGATFALLWAPQPGERTRTQIRKTAEDIQTRADLAMTSAKYHGERVVKEITEHAENIREEAKQTVDVVKEEGKAIVNETKKIVSEGWEAEEDVDQVAAP